MITVLTMLRVTYGICVHFRSQEVTVDVLLVAVVLFSVLKTKHVRVMVHVSAILAHIMVMYVLNAMIIVVISNYVSLSDNYIFVRFSHSFTTIACGRSTLIKLHEYQYRKSIFSIYRISACRVISILYYSGIT